MVTESPSNCKFLIVQLSTEYRPFVDIGREAAHTGTSQFIRGREEKVTVTSMILRLHLQFLV